MSTEDHLDQATGGDNVRQCAGLDSKELETAYEVFMNTQGNIPTTELPIIFNTLGISLSENDLEKAIKDAVDNYGEYLERDSFMMYMEQRTHQWPSHLDVIEAFRVFDHEGQGYIKTSQLKKLMQSAQLGVDENAIDALIQDSCPDGGDDISYEYFVDSIRQQTEGKLGDYDTEK
ncbi:calmodulin-A-like [Dysidea avara]|uniref:calmodulin-A-like n=1 Tax=Dysidea avara TaxID=196820 RepID=UPI0033172398